uniref:Uncharacterized protein n=1 Tax=Anopheles farauti TaxID=69004 RepID=A0A182QAH8_9DIPT
MSTNSGRTVPGQLSACRHGRNVTPDDVHRASGSSETRISTSIVIIVISAVVVIFGNYAARANPISVRCLAAMGSGLNRPYGEHHDTRADDGAASAASALSKSLEFPTRVTLAQMY